MPSKKQNKTQKTNKSVLKFLDSVEHEQRRKDAKQVLALMKKVTKMKPYLWGDSIIGFGDYEYKRSDGSEHRFFRIGFSPRKTALTIYIMPGISRYNKLADKLGKYKSSVACLYINKLEDIDLKILEKMMKESLKEMKRLYG